VSKLRTVSWVLLVLVGAMVLFAAGVSASLAYRGDYTIAGVGLSEVAAGRAAVLTGLRGVRGTGAAWAAAFAVLFLFVAAGPYRRGDVASWWGILAAVLTLVGIAALRVPLLGTSLGAGAPIVLAGVVVVALLLDARRLGGDRRAG
jgi:hypothetical protein